MENFEFGTAWIVAGIMLYVAFSAYMAFNNLGHMKRHPFIGGLLLLMALVLGPFSLLLLMVYALVIGVNGKPNNYFPKQEQILEEWQG